MWFSDEPEDRALAKRTCLSCPLMLQCRELGKGQEYGIWGGVEASRRLGAPRKAETYEVMALVREGLTNYAIAERLHINERTVRRIRAGNRAA